MARKGKRKKLSTVIFKNGAVMRCYYVPKPPKKASGANDNLFIELSPEQGRGEVGGWWMNTYDICNLIWLLSAGATRLQELGIKETP